MFAEGFLTLDRIICADDASSKKRVLQRMGALLATGDDSLDGEDIFVKLLERERLGSTGLGHGVGLPHARYAGVSEARGALITLQQGIDYGAMDQQPVNLIFGLLVPESEDTEHLEILATLAGIFSDAAWRKALLQGKNSRDILTTFHDGVQRPEPV